MPVSTWRYNNYPLVVLQLALVLAITSMQPVHWTLPWLAVLLDQERWTCSPQLKEQRTRSNPPATKLLQCSQCVAKSRHHQVERLQLVIGFRFRQWLVAVAMSGSPSWRPCPAETARTDVVQQLHSCRGTQTRKEKRWLYMYYTTAGLGPAAKNMYRLGNLLSARTFQAGTWRLPSCLCHTQEQNGWTEWNIRTTAASGSISHVLRQWIIL